MLKIWVYLHYVYVDHLFLSSDLRVYRRYVRHVLQLSQCVLDDENRQENNAQIFWVRKLEVQEPCQRYLRLEIECANLGLLISKV